MAVLSLEVPELKGQLTHRKFDMCSEPGGLEKPSVKLRAFIAGQASIDMLDCGESVLQPIGWFLSWHGLCPQEGRSGAGMRRTEGLYTPRRAFNRS
jgi:hypothetical protein